MPLHPRRRLCLAAKPLVSGWSVGRLHALTLPANGHKAFRDLN